MKHSSMTTRTFQRDFRTNNSISSQEKHPSDTKRWGRLFRLKGVAGLLCLCLLLGGCAAIDFSYGLLAGIPTSDVHYGHLGETLPTRFREITVESVSFSQDFYGYQVRDGFQFLIVELKETGTYDGEPLSLSPYDYYVDGRSFESFVYANELEDVYAGYRYEGELPFKESQRWTLPFVVPSTVEEYLLTHVEYYDQGTRSHYVIPIENTTA